jgi:hypothetical protein
LNHWSHLVQLVVRSGDGVHLLFVHELVTLLHLFALLGPPVLEPYLDLQEQTSLSALSANQQLLLNYDMQIPLQPD